MFSYPDTPRRKYSHFLQREAERKKLLRRLFHPLEFSLCASQYSFSACNLMCCVFVGPFPPVHRWLQCHTALHFCRPPGEKWSLTLHIFHLNCIVGRMLYTVYIRARYVSVL